MQRPIEPSEEMSVDDPIGYIVEKASYDKKVKLYNQNQVLVELKHFSSGLYYVRMVLNSGVIVEPIVVYQ